MVLNFKITTTEGEIQVKDEKQKYKTTFMGNYAVSIRKGAAVYLAAIGYTGISRCRNSGAPSNNFSCRKDRFAPCTMFHCEVVWY